MPALCKPIKDFGAVDRLGHDAYVFARADANVTIAERIQANAFRDRDRV